MTAKAELLACTELTDLHRIIIFNIVNRNSFAVATDPAGAGAGIDSERAEFRRRGRRRSSS